MENTKKTIEETMEEKESLERWARKEKAVTLTNDQWNTIICYILHSTQHRKTEGKAWDDLAQEKNPDGTPKYPNAQSNALYYVDLEIKLKQILEAIEQTK